MKKILLGVILLGVFSTLILKTGLFSYDALVPDIFAAIREPTHIEIERGTVSVNGTAVEDGFVLNAGDYVEVGQAAEVSIVFFDNSVSRLASGTELTITQVEGVDSKQSASHVKLSLSLGQIWSKVTKLVNSESTFEVSTSDVAAAVRGSAFDIAVSEDGNTAVMAVEHTLQLKKVRNSTAEKDESVAIVEGQKAVSQPRVRRATVTPDASVVPESSVRFKVERIADDERETTWFRQNERADVIQDIKVRRKIERAQEKLVGSLPGDLGYTIKNLRDTTFLTLANKPEDKAEVASKIAERKIIEAQVLMRRGDDLAAEKQLVAAQDLIARAVSARDESTDAETKSRIDQNIARTIDNSKQMTSSTTAVDRDYATKEFIYQVEVTSATDDKKEAVKKDQYQHRIVEAYDLAKAGKTDSAKKVVRSLAEDIQTDFENTSEENDISDDNLDQVLVDPYLEATIRRIEQIESTEELFSTGVDKFIQRKPIEASESELQNGKMIVPELSSAQKFGEEGFLPVSALDRQNVEDVSEQTVILQNKVEAPKVETKTDNRQSWEDAMPVLSGQTSEIQLTDDAQTGQPTIQITEKESPKLESKSTAEPTLQQSTTSVTNTGTPRVSTPVVTTTQLSTKSAVTTTTANTATTTTTTTTGTPQVSAEAWLKQKTEETKAEKAANASANTAATEDDTDYFFGGTDSVEIEIKDSSTGSKFDPQVQAKVEEELNTEENTHQSDSSTTKSSNTGATGTEQNASEGESTTNTKTATDQATDQADSQSPQDFDAEIDEDAFGATVLLDGTQIDLGGAKEDTVQKFENSLDYEMNF